ncbi:MAG TPA: hypothetical protein G4O10_02405 [Dehalococcoidia bacterium]|nr:hypothetical protein [Dehalococcoidia bacterium]
MEGNLGRFKVDLERLSKLSDTILADLADEATGKKVKTGDPKPGLMFRVSYQRWYSEAHEVIRQILPTRLQEFETLYYGSDKRKELNVITYAIKDWLLGIGAKVDIRGEKYFDDVGATYMRFQTQVEILNSAKLRFESSLFEVRQIL